MAQKINLAQFDRVISHFDGNNNDKDDIAALPVSASLTEAAGLSNKSTYFYNNNLGEPNIPAQVQQMRKSAAFAEKQGINLIALHKYLKPLWCIDFAFRTKKLFFDKAIAYKY